MRRYPAYRDSGVQWLGEVPEGWEVRPVKGAFEVVGGTTPKSDVPEYWDGDINWVTPADLSNLPTRFIFESSRQITEAGLDSCGTTLVQPGSIVLSVRAPIGSLAIAGREVCTNQGCKALVPKSLAHSDFYFFVLGAAREALNILGRGSTFLELSGDQLAAFRVPLPPLPEQTAIAAFLDRETAKIDALVAEQRRLIDLLREKRQAVISHAVTKGLNPNAPLKPSGIDWLGDVPEGWEVKKVSAVCERMTYGFTNPMPTTDEGPFLLTAADIEDGAIAFATARRTSEYAFENLLTDKSRPISGDVLITKDGTLGRVAVADGSRVCINQSVALLRLIGTEMRPQFLAKLLSGSVHQARMIYEAGGTTIKHIYISRLAQMPIPVPPIDEQGQILDWLEARLPQFDNLISEGWSALALLQERRAALISAAVTGKIDVRHLSPAATEAA